MHELQFNSCTTLYNFLFHSLFLYGSIAEQYFKKLHRLKVVEQGRPALFEQDRIKIMLHGIVE